MGKNNVVLIQRGLLIVILLAIFTIPSLAQQAVGCYTSSGKPVPCGTRWTDTYNGVEYECYCDCSKTPPAQCTAKSSSGSSTSNYNSTSSSADNALMILNMINSVIDYSNSQENEAAQRAAELEASRIAEEKRIKEAADQAKYEKEMESFKPISTPEKTNNFQLIHFTCKVISYSGVVQIKKANGGNFTSLGGENLDLGIGDVIKTGPNGRIKIHFDFEDGGKDILIDNSSEFKIAVGSDGTQFPMLVKGRIHGISAVLDDLIEQTRKEFLETEIGKTLKRKLQIRTPSVVVATRGTEFTLSEDSVKGSEVIVLEGSVEMKDLVNQKTMVIDSGYKGIVTIDGEVLGPIEVVLPDIIKWWEE